jgi:hypothetical protein
MSVLMITAECEEVIKKKRIFFETAKTEISVVSMKPFGQPEHHII